MKKRGSTTINIILVIGLLFISVTVGLSLKNLYAQQAQWVEEDVATAMLNRIKSEIESAQVHSDTAHYQVEITISEPYQLNVTTGEISLYFPERDTFVRSPLILPNTNILETSIENLGVIHIHKKDRHLMLITNTTCNLEDEICDLGCIVQGLCDHTCYTDGISDNVCNPYCVDANLDGRITIDDYDSICDLDCYNEDRNGYVYDVDCLRSNDNICEVDSHTVTDGFCDTDCLGTNGVCDPDCSEYDADCPHKNNGICEIELGENCHFFENDCGCDSGYSCRRECGAFDETAYDEKGCLDSSVLSKEGESCQVDCMCDNDLLCDHTNHCCPENFHFVDGFCKPFDNDLVCDTSGEFFPPETCINSADCECPDGFACCAHASNSASEGCAPMSNELGPTSSNPAVCGCDSQCEEGVCSQGRCCEKGYKWDGATCVVDCNACETQIQAETCDNCDCTKANFCQENQICCPSATGADPLTSCAPDPNLGIGDVCTCSNQCGNGHSCVGSTEGTDGQMHCCPNGDDYWTPSGCKKWVVYTKEASINWGGNCHVFNLGGSCDPIHSSSSDCRNGAGERVLERVENCFSDDQKTAPNHYLIVSGRNECRSSPGGNLRAGTFQGFWNELGGSTHLRAYVEGNNLGKIPNPC